MGFDLDSYGTRVGFEVDPMWFDLESDWSLWVSNWIPLGFDLDTIWSLWDSIWIMSEFFGVRAGLNVDHLGFDMDSCEVRFGLSLDPMRFDLDSMGILWDSIWIPMKFDLDSIWILWGWVWMRSGSLWASIWILFGSQHDPNITHERVQVTSPGVFFSRLRREWNLFTEGEGELKGEGNGGRKEAWVAGMITSDTERLVVLCHVILLCTILCYHVICSGSFMGSCSRVKDLV